jgi:hypothetical protein
LSRLNSSREIRPDAWSSTSRSQVFRLSHFVPFVFVPVMATI